MTNVRLIDAELPDFGVPDKRPELSVAIYAARLGRLAAAAKHGGLDAVVIYALPPFFRLPRRVLARH